MPQSASRNSSSHLSSREKHGKNQSVDKRTRGPSKNALERPRMNHSQKRNRSRTSSPMNVPKGTKETNAAEKVAKNIAIERNTEAIDSSSRNNDQAKLTRTQRDENSSVAIANSSNKEKDQSVLVPVKNDILNELSLESMQERVAKKVSSAGNDSKRPKIIYTGKKFTTTRGRDGGFSKLTSIGFGASNNYRYNGVSANPQQQRYVYEGASRQGIASRTNSAGATGTEFSERHGFRQRPEKKPVLKSLVNPQATPKGHYFLHDSRDDRHHSIDGDRRQSLTRELRETKQAHYQYYDSRRERSSFYDPRASKVGHSRTITKRQHPYSQQRPLDLPMGWRKNYDHEDQVNHQQQYGEKDVSIGAKRFQISEADAVSHWGHDKFLELEEPKQTAADGKQHCSSVAVNPKHSMKKEFVENVEEALNSYGRGRGQEMR